MLTINDATRQANDADEKHESGIARRIYILYSGMARRGSSKRTESGITRRILSQAYNPTDTSKQIHKTCKHMAESGITRRGYASVYIILSQA